MMISSGERGRAALIILFRRFSRIRVCVCVCKYGDECERIDESYADFMHSHSRALAAAYDELKSLSFFFQLVIIGFLHELAVCDLRLRLVIFGLIGFVCVWF